jgi:hypothetical protein
MSTPTPPTGNTRFTETDTMNRVLEAAPQARAVLMRYHIGGCNHCGFESADTVRKVAEDNGIPPRSLLAALNEA